ncbi:hypothetical protein K469DRAFT_158289 [Zopfia rhizophila CBS 207.26]|uniref:Uncharacterized protein n=1 Tax=Zopfia rhizophila CBS 207.26 TaxID=1314779 RepID=A0A6A6E288_9PEZI|nr:hypothetical protein K469DRAFT_158289 [Zopfia rhizophila CBS 207.26]
MRFSVPCLTIIASSTLASPKPFTTRDITTTEDVTKAIAFAAQAADCDTFQCANVIASVACIDISIPLGAARIPGAVGLCGWRSECCVWLFP